MSIINADSLCTNCTILAGQPGLEFEDGTPADPAHGVYIHHILSVDISRVGRMPVLPCDAETYDLSRNPINPVVPVAGFVGQGEDNGDSAIMFTSRDGSFNSGFHVDPKTQILVQSDFLNYNNHSVPVYITLDLEYVDGQHGLDAISALVSVKGCKLEGPDISHDGPAETMSQQFPVLSNGTLISMSKCVQMGRSGLLMLQRGSFAQRWRENGSLPQRQGDLYIKGCIRRKRVYHSHDNL
jgi:hypothetical protein